jgi:hypothetical protein
MSCATPTHLPSLLLPSVCGSSQIYCQAPGSLEPLQHNRFKSRLLAIFQLGAFALPILYIPHLRIFHYHLSPPLYVPSISGKLTLS